MNTGIARAGCKLSRGFEEHVLDWGATVLQSNGCSLQGMLKVPPNTKEFSGEDLTCSLPTHCYTVHLCIFIDSFGIVARVSTLWLR